MALTGWRVPIQLKDGVAVGCLKTEPMPGTRRELVFADGSGRKAMGNDWHTMEHVAHTYLVGPAKPWHNATKDPPPLSTPVLVWGKPERGDEPEIGLEQLHDDGLWYGWYEITHWRELPEGPR